MQKLLLSVALATLAPMAALALPAVGDMIGTDPETAKTALDAAGCPVEEFEAEDGKVEAVCTDTATGKAIEVEIDPATGLVTAITDKD
jgi:Peptidase propeptide and YPEB domain